MAFLVQVHVSAHTPPKASPFYVSTSLIILSNWPIQLAICTREMYPALAEQY